MELNNYYFLSFIVKGASWHFFLFPFSFFFFLAVLRKWPVSVKVILGHVRSRFGNESRKTTFFIMRTCPFHSVPWLLSDFGSCVAPFLIQLSPRYFLIFSIVYLIFSRAIKPGAFSDIKTL